MSKHYYKHKVTGIVAELDDSFAAIFPGKLEQVSAPVAAKSVTVEENAAVVEAANNEEESKPSTPAKTTKKPNSSKEGNN